MGLSLAYQLARRSSLKISLYEKGAGVGEGSTGASSAVCRFRYSLDEMVILARCGITAYRNWSEFTKIQCPLAKFHDDGVLWMSTGDPDWAEREHLRMTALGVRTEVLDDQAVQERFPALSVCPITPDFLTGEPHDCRAGDKHYFEVDGGYIDPVEVTNDLVDSCLREGVELSFNSEIESLETDNQRVTGVCLQGGKKISSPLVVNAAGPWCNKIFALCSLKLPWKLVPTRIQIVYLDCPVEISRSIPVVEDSAGGIYFRLQNNGQQLVVGSLMQEHEDEQVKNMDYFNRFIDPDFEQTVLHALHHRIPGLPYRGAVRGYSGLYTMNRDDVHPVIGATSLEGLYAMNGFSGHGFKLAPAVSAMLARQITGESLCDDPDVASEFLAFGRRPIILETKGVLA